MNRTLVALGFVLGGMACDTEPSLLEPETSMEMSAVAQTTIDATARAWAGAALVNGTIVVAGGGLCTPGSASCALFGQDETAVTESFDPASNSWTANGILNQARFSHGLVTANNKLYAVGGTSGSASSPIATVEEYDPAADSWTAKSAAMPTPRWKVAATAVNGIVYTAGGGASGNQCVPSAALEAYDPAADAWQTKTSVPTARWGAASVPLDGRVLVMGGSRQCPQIIVTISDALEIYDPVADAWTAGSPMSVPRWDLAAAVVDGKAYAIGGFDGVTQTILDAVEEYDPATNTWTARAPMPTARTGLVAVSFNSKIYAIGGFNGSQVLSVVEVYDPATDAWTQLGPPDGTGFAVDRLEVAGNISGGFLDEFDDGSLVDPPTNAIRCTSPTGESGGFLALPLPGTFCVLGELAAQHRLTDGAGDATVTATFRPDVPGTGEGYRLQVFTAGPTSPNEGVSIEVQNAGAGPRVFTSVIPVSGDPPVVGDPVGGVPVSISLDGVEEVLLRLEMDDDSEPNTVGASYSLNGGGSFTDAPLPVAGEVMVRADEAVVAVSGFGGVPPENGLPAPIRDFDGDGDGVLDITDNCLWDVQNPGQIDTDDDGLGDVCEGFGLSPGVVRASVIEAVTGWIEAGQTLNAVPCYELDQSWKSKVIGWDFDGITSEEQACATRSGPQVAGEFEEEKNRMADQEGDFWGQFVDHLPVVSDLIFIIKEAIHGIIWHKQLRPALLQVESVRTTAIAAKEMSIQLSPSTTWWDFFVLAPVEVDGDVSGIVVGDRYLTNSLGLSGAAATFTVIRVDAIEPTADGAWILVSINGLAREAELVPPVISHTLLEAAYPLNSSPVRFQFSAIDEGAGLASITSTLNGKLITSGSALTFVDVGPHVIVIEARDIALNETRELVSFDVTMLVKVKPGDAMPCINRKSKGNTPVAILATPTFDPADLDARSVQAGGIPAERWSAAKDVNGDGVRDLVLHFDTQQLAQAGALENGAEFKVTATLPSGVGVYGVDTVYLVGGPQCS